MNKLRLWNQHSSWDQADEAWDKGAYEASERKKIKTLSQLPNMPGMTPETARFLKWKSLWWMIRKDTDGAIRKGVFKHPFRYGARYIKSFFQKKPFSRRGDFFLYGIKDFEEFEHLIKSDNVFVIGFSYCHKPFECPSGRFTADCIHDPSNDICRQCFIGKSVNAMPDRKTIPLFIPTIHYIGEKIFEIVHANPSKQVIFLITACEMTLEMFGDWGNMAGIKGVGVRLDGRICNTMRAFELSETGIKPGLTVVLEDTQKQMLEWIRLRREG